MNYKRHITTRGGYLLIRYTGSLALEDLPRGQNAFQHIADICEQQNCSGVLLDARDLTMGLSTMDVFRLGSLVAKVRGRPIRFAMLGPEQQAPLDDFMETVATNRGALVRIFSSEDEAAAWLTDK